MAACVPREFSSAIKPGTVKGGRDNGEIWGFGQVRNVGIAEHPGHGPVFGVHRHDRARKSALKQVAHDHIADPVRSIRGADNGYRLGLEQAFESAHAHAVSLPLGTN